jgi:RNA polymerase sigma factor (sigma-70 family)
MPNPVLSEFVARVRRAVLAHAPGQDQADGWLLTRFVASRDEAAFAALVRRHGPMVLGVCRRVAGDAHLADDAFQAAFLVLARRAAVVKPREAVRAWLYGVAVRTAREARAMSARRRSREVPVTHVPDRPAPVEAPTDPDAIRALDEEIARLPDHLRTAVVLCELDGLGRKDVAARLGIPEGTLSSRLAKARKVLADRLRGRGVALTAAGLAALYGQAAQADGVTTALADAAARLASPGPVSAAVAELSRGVFRTMLLSKLKLATAGVALAVAVGWAATGGMPGRTRAGDPPAKPAPERPAPAPPAVAHSAGRIVFAQGAAFSATDPDGANERRIELPPDGGNGAVLSPDGRSLAWWTEAGDDPGRVALCVRALDGKGPGTRIDLPTKFKDGQGFIMFCWSPTGRELYVNTGTPGTKGVTHLRVDVTAKTAVPLTGLTEHLITDVSRDGKQVLTTRVGDGAEWMPNGLYLMSLDGTGQKSLTGPNDAAMGGKLSPDGKRVLCRSNNRLAVLDVDKPGSLTPVAGVPEKTEVIEFTWSPDSRRIVYTTGSFNPADVQNMESRLIVADPDGKNAKQLRSVKGELIRLAGWR